MSHGPPSKVRRNSNSNDDNETELDELPVPPDGGWGWVVAFASFAIHIVSKFYFYKILLILYSQSIIVNTC